MSNTYLVLQGTLRRSFYLEHGGEFDVLLTLLYVFQGLCVVLNLFTLYWRFSRGKFWLFRVAHTTSGATLWLPNSLLFWLFWSTVYHAFAIYYTYRTILSGKVGSDMTDYSFCMTTPWLAVWVGGVFWAWSTTLAPFLLPRGVSEFSRYGTLVPALITAFYIMTLVGGVTPILTYAILANKEFNSLFVLFQQMDKTLTQASIDFISGNTSQVPSDSVLAAGQAIFEAKFDQFVALWVPLWQTWVALDFLMLGVYIGSAWMAWRDLSRAFNDLLRTRNSSGDIQYARQMSRLIWNQRSLVLSSVVVIFVLFCAIGFSVPLAVKSTTVKILSGERIAEVVRLASLLCATSLTGFSNVGIFILSLATLQSNAPRETNTILRRKRSAQGAAFVTTGQVDVTVEVQLHEVADQKSKDGLSHF